MSAPSVSVVVPVYNGNRYLAAALDSVLGQSSPPAEVLVIDDGSSEPPGPVLAKYASRVRLIRQDNRGPAAARNLGIQRASGEFVAFIDQDDLWTPGRLARQLQRFALEPGLSICFGHVELFWEPGLEAEARVHQQQTRGRVVPGYTTPAMLAHCESFVSVGPLDAALTFGDATEWIMRAHAAGLRSAMLPDVVLRHRMHASNLTRRRDESKREFVRIVRAHVDRLRGRRPSPSADASRA